MGGGMFDVSRHAYAHRGLWGEIRRGQPTPENSLAAFHTARTQGVGVELDVRLTRDRVPVVFHDATLTRMCKRDVALADIEICDPRDAMLPNGFPIPTLPAALDALGDAPVLIELKVDTPGDTAVADIVASTISGRGGKLAVMSFDEATVARLRALITGRPVGLLIDKVAHIGADEALRKTKLALEIGCDYLGPHHSALHAVTAAIAPLPLVCWTVRTPDELALARRFGAAPIFEGFSASVALSSLDPI
jgi:glycerophosphoryl diester phosphodiesterase